MSRLTEFAIAKRSVTILLAVALFIAGISAWGSLKQELLPDIEFPVITIIAPYPGAGAEDVADQVAGPIERAVAGVPRLESLQSTSANSMSLVVALFSFGTDVDAVEAEINALPNQRVELEGVGATVRARDDIRFTRTPAGGTHVDYVADIELTGWMRLLTPFVGGALRRIGQQARDGMQRELDARVDARTEVAP